MDGRESREPHADSGLDAFFSYSRRDQPFVLELKNALEERGRTIWIDADDIPPAAPWRRELGTGIEAADAFVFVISPDSVASVECATELQRADELGKRLVPVVYRPTSGVPDALSSLQHIDFERNGDRGRAIEQLDRAIETDHDWVRAHTQWLARALRWDEGRRDRSRLLRGSELEAAERWLARQAEGKKPPPTALQTDYIVAGRGAERRRLRTVIAWTLVALGVSVALGALALISKSEAIEQRDQSRSRELAAAALSQLGTDPERSLLLALQAEEVAPSGPAHDALRRSLVESRVRVVMKGHRGSVNRLALSGDGRRMVTTGSDRTARVFDTASGEPLSVLGPLRARIWMSAISPDGSRVATASDDGTARLWDAADGRLVATPRHRRGAVSSAAFSPDGRWLVTAGGDGTVRVWAVATGRSVAVLRGHRGEVRSAVFDPRGELILSAGRDGEARLWELDSSRSEVLARHSAPLFLADFSRDGRRALTTDDTGVVQVWRISDGRRLSELGGRAFDAAFNPDGNRIAIATTAGLSSVWDAGTGRQAVPLAGHGGPVMDAGFSPDGSLVVTAGHDRTARIWDAEQATNIAVLRGHTGIVSRAMFTPDGRSVVTVSGDGTARRWDVGIGVAFRGREDRASEVRAAELSPDGQILVTAANPGLVRLWDARTGTQTPHRDKCGLPASADISCLTAAVLADAQIQNEAVSFSPDGRRVAVAGADGIANVRATDSGSTVADLEGHRGRVNGIAFSSDGRRVATAGEDGSVRIWDAAGRSEPAVLRGHDRAVYAVVFTPGGGHIVSGGEDGTIRIWRATGGRPVRTIRTGDSVLDLAVSPDGRYVAAPVDTTVRVWSMSTGEPVSEMQDHEATVHGVGFSPDGRTLVSGGQDLTARLWEVASGRPLGVLRGHSEYLVGARFGPDGQSVVTAGADGTARIFRCDACGSVEQLVRRARDRATRPLSAGERARFLD